MTLKLGLEYQGSFGQGDQSRTTDLGKPAGQDTKQPQFWLRCRKQQTNLEMHSSGPRDVANDVLWEAGLLSIPQRASSPPPTSVIPVSGFRIQPFFFFPLIFIYEILECFLVNVLAVFIFSLSLYPRTQCCRRNCHYSSIH